MNTVSKAIYRVARVEQALASSEGLIFEVLAEEMGIHARTIRRTVQDLVDLGIEIEREQQHPHYVYRLARPKQGGVLRPSIAAQISAMKE